MRAGHGPDRLPGVMATLLNKRVRMQGFIILDHYADGYAAFQRDMKAWVASGEVKQREDIVNGLENAPAGLIGLLEGRNFGKAIVRIAD